MSKRDIRLRETSQSQKDWYHSVHLYGVPSKVRFIDGKHDGGCQGLGADVIVKWVQSFRFPTQRVLFSSNVNILNTPDIRLKTVKMVNVRCVFFFSPHTKKMRHQGNPPSSVGYLRTKFTGAQHAGLGAPLAV